MIDGDGDAVAEIDWESDQERAEDAFGSDLEWARVILTDEPGIEADSIRVESTIEGWEAEVSGEDQGDWADSWVTVALHPAGDQIVVTAITDGAVEIVHREHFEP